MTSPRVRRRRVEMVALALALTGATVSWALSRGAASGSAPVRRSSTSEALRAAAANDPGHLAPGSDPRALPGSVLLADEGNDRLIVVDPRGRITWSFPRPGDLAPGVEFRSPDDAFFTPDGRQIIATEEEFSVVSLVDIASHRIVWRYGTPGVPGDGANHLSNPDDAIVLPGGDVLTADIKNCRLLLLSRTSLAPIRVYGTTTRACHHSPPVRFGSPNGAFPMANGHYLVTEINGDWVDEMDLSGRIYRSLHPPGVSYPSDTNEAAPGVYLTVDYSDPGQIETFDPSGRLLWRYRPTGGQALDKPSLALTLPNGDVIATDDADDRVIVVDPRSNRIVWQYGVRGRPGASPGMLNGVDGLDPVPPYSELVRHAAAMAPMPPGPGR